MDFSTTSLKPWNVTIDGQVYKVQKLNMMDYAGISAEILRSRRDAILEDESIEDKEERIKKANNLSGLDPFEVRNYLASDPAGIVLCIYVSLKKNQPEINYDLVSSLPFNDTLIQLVCDILDIKISVSDKSKEEKKK